MIKIHLFNSSLSFFPLFFSSNFSDTINQIISFPNLFKISMIGMESMITKPLTNIISRSNDQNLNPHLIKRVVRRFLPELPYHVFVLSVSKTWFLFLQLGKFSFLKGLQQLIRKIKQKHTIKQTKGKSSTLKKTYLPPITETKIQFTLGSIKL